ncbi:MAG: hypothetical protein LM590_04970 [Thermofilum sp.]|nr:hypothetical protein [Thermofilum sp.]
MSSVGTHALAHLGTAMLYALHVTLDAHTPPTPALRPLAPSIQVKIAVSGRISPQGPAPAASAAVATSPTDFTRKPSVEGPLVSETGLVLAATTLALTAAEHLAKSREC